MKKNLLFPSISGLALIITILILTFILPCPTNAQYTIFRIILSIAVGGFAAVIPGFFNFRYAGVISAGGGLAVFAFAYIYTPRLIDTNDRCGVPLSFTIRLRDTADNMPVRKDARLTIIVPGSYKSTEPIDDQGSATFTRIPAGLNGKEANLSLEYQGWWFTNAKRETIIPLSGGDIKVLVERDNSLCCVSGAVRDSATGTFLEDATVRIGDISTKTSSNGTFSLSIPPILQHDEYQLVATRRDYSMAEYRVSGVNASGLTIKLNKAGK